MYRLHVPQTGSRSGLALVAALATLLIVMLIAAALLQSLLMHRRTSRTNEQQQQAFWLAESALQRAVQSLSESDEYEGETWRVPVEVLGGPSSGIALIDVKPMDGPVRGWRVRVEARYPDGTMHSFLEQRELAVPDPTR